MQGHDDEAGRGRLRFGVAFGVLAGLAVAVVLGGAGAYLLLGGDEPERRSVAATSDAGALALPSRSELLVARDAALAEGAGGRSGSAYERAVAADRPRLEALTLDDAGAAALGLVITSNGFDNQDPPSPDAVFRYPLPGQTPRSALVREFFASGFIVGRAQSYLPADGAPGRLGVVIWAFADAAGAHRAFRAFRDLTGKERRPSTFAPVAALLGDSGAGASELLWVRGRVLVRATAAVADVGDALARTAAVREELARGVDAAAAREFPSEAPAEPTLAGARTFSERLDVLRVPDLDLPGGISTVEPVPGLGGTFLDVTRGSIGATPLERRLSALGFRGGESQRLRVGLRGTGQYGLAAYVFPDEAAATAALAAIRAHASTRVGADATFPGAFAIAGPDPAAYSDLFWQRGALVLQAGMYAPRAAPLLPEMRMHLARLLDERAASWSAG